MRRMVIIPDGWPCTFAECPPGHFLFEQRLYFKSEYSTNEGAFDAYCDSGEYFVGSVATKEERGKLIVQPVLYEWQEYEL